MIITVLKITALYEYYDDLIYNTITHSVIIDETFRNYSVSKKKWSQHLVYWFQKEINAEFGFIDLKLKYMFIVLLFVE